MAVPQIPIKLAVEPEIITRAKDACGLSFREVLDLAKERGLLKEIEDNLTAAGFIAPQKKSVEGKVPRGTRSGTPYRIKALSPATLDAIDKIRDRTGIDRNSLVRAILIKLGDTVDQVVITPPAADHVATASPMSEDGQQPADQ